MTANINFIKPLLPTALYVLLSLLVLPDSDYNFSSKDVYLSDPITSQVGIQNDDLGKPDGDNQKFNRSTEPLIVAPASVYSTFSPAPVHGPDIAFTVSQARAPPLY